ncbi:MAG: PaREP1 family protein [Candidatus Bathyarchaeia archaeon]
MAKADYLRLNSKYLKEAEGLLAKGDYPQASGKLWGAFVEAVKALAAEEGVGLGTHRSIPNGG